MGSKFTYRRIGQGLTTHIEKIKARISARGFRPRDVNGQPIALCRSESVDRASESDDYGDYDDPLGLESDEPISAATNEQHWSAEELKPTSTTGFRFKSNKTDIDNESSIARRGSLWIIQINAGR